MSKKVPFSKCVREAYEGLTNKNEEKSLLVSDWEWFLKADWHLRAGCSFGILLFLYFFYMLNASECVNNVFCTFLYMYNASECWKDLICNAGFCVNADTQILIEIYNKSISLALKKEGVFF